MRKLLYAICEQQRRRSPCASAQSDQRLFVRCVDSIVSVAEQAGLSLTWSQTPKTGFLVTWHI